MKIGFIATSLNEKESVSSFLNSILSQTKKPDEVVFVDGGSSDGTLEEILKYKAKFASKKIKFRTHLLKGNISKCRNFAVRKTTSEVIAISDFGCALEKTWLEKITAHFEKKEVDVVAGYYKGKYKNIFQKSLIPYALIMPDKTRNDFLPASRSMAIRKKVFNSLKGFDEKLSYGEDYDLALRLKKKNKKIVFEKKAVVGWSPRKNLLSAFKMFYRYAYGDIQAGNIRPKVMFVFARYLFALFTLLGARFVSLEFLLSLLSAYIVAYGTWSVLKNYKYVNHSSALFYLPLIQFTSDLAVMTGSLLSMGNKIVNSIYSFAKKNIVTTLAVAVFAGLVISVVNWGLPNSNHPFTYHMDEWHQLQSVRNLFVHLSPNIEGSANGPIFHFALSGLYIVVLAFVGLVNPFAISSSLTNLDIQNTLFIYLRLSTLLFALGSVFILIYILKKQLKLTSIYLPVILFLFSPIWISLSNYFKYDIALIFWITLSVLFLFRFRDNPTLKNYLIAAVPVSLSVTTKISAMPLLIIYIFSFLLFKPERIRNLSYPILGIFLFAIIFLLFGIPDAILGTGNYFEYFHSNLARTPNETYNYSLKSPYWIYLFTNQIPALFGFVLSGGFALSVIYFLRKARVMSFKKTLRERRNEVFLLFSFFIFAFSLIPMKLFIINRSLVVLPFAVLFTGLVFQEFYKSNKKSKLIMLLVSILLFLHVVQGFSWITTKYNDPREDSSKWISENVPQGSEIGIEIIPIYQFLPDNILFDYYATEQNLNLDFNYKYKIVSSQSDILPEYIILSNSDIDLNYLYNSPKKDLLYRMKEEGYREIKAFNVNRDLNKLFTGRLDFHISLLSPVPNIYIYKK